MSDYRTFWQVDRAVFLRPADVDRPFFTDALKAKLERAKQFSMGDRALVVVTGEPGSGKSTVARWFYECIPQDAHDVQLMSLVQRETDSGWLSPRLAELMGIRLPETTDSGQLLVHIASRLDDLIVEGRRLIVVIDAAHLASTPDALGEIAALLNVQALATPCLSFVLVGDTTLLETLERAVDLKAKVAFAVTLPRLTVEETQAYLAHRAATLGIPSPFELDAVAMIHARSQGVLAAIDAYAENCLVEAFEGGQRQITAEVAARAARHLTPGARDQEVLTHATPAALAPATAPSGPLARPKTGSPAAAAEAAPENVAIKLSSLFKSEPGRQKP